MLKAFVSIITFACIATLALSANSTTAATRRPRYPLIMWATEDVTHSREFQHAINMTEAVRLIKNFTELSNSTNVVAIVVEGMTSRDLVISAKEYPYLRRVVRNAQMYTNLKESFDFNAFSTLDENARLY